MLLTSSSSGIRQWVMLNFYVVVEIVPYPACWKYEMYTNKIITIFVCTLILATLESSHCVLFLLSSVIKY